MKCKNCGAEVNSCQNPECINLLHDSGSFTSTDYTVFCEEGKHYCEKECLVEEFRSCGIQGVESDWEED